MRVRSGLLWCRRSRRLFGIGPSLGRKKILDSPFQIIAVFNWTERGGGSDDDVEVK